MKISTLRNKINKAIASLPSDWKISTCMWVSWNLHKCCPLGAIMLGSLGKEHYILEEPVENLSKIGLTEEEGYSFAGGFDGTPYVYVTGSRSGKNDYDFWKLGRHYRERFAQKVVRQ